MPAQLNTLSISTYVSGSDARIVLHWIVYGLEYGDFAKVERSTDGISWSEYDTAPTYTYAGQSYWGLLDPQGSSYTDGNGGNRSGVAYTLTVGQRYWYRVRNENSGEYTGYADNNAAGVNIVAGAGSSGSSVTNFNVSFSSAQNAIIGTWTDLADEAAYAIEKQQYFSTGGYWSSVGMSFSPTLPANTITFTDTSISGNTRYRYRINAATNGGLFGTPSAWDEVITGTIVGPSGPTNLNADAVSISEIDLTWTDNSFDEDFFVVERATLDTYTGQYTDWLVLISSLAPDTISYNDTFGLIPNTTYKYRVKTLTGSVSSPYSNEATASTTGSTGITAPTNLSGSYVSPSLTLTWNDNSNNETGFVLEKSSGSGFVVLANLGANTTNYVDSNVTEGQTYSYRVKAITATNSSTYSNIFTIVIGGATGDGYGIGAFYGLSVYHHNFFVARNMLIRDNSMENNGEGNFNADLLASPNVTVDNPQSESLMIRRGITIYT